MEVVAVDKDLESKLPAITFAVGSDHPISFGLGESTPLESSGSSSESSDVDIGMPKARKLSKRHPRPRGDIFFKSIYPVGGLEQEQCV